MANVAGVSGLQGASLDDKRGGMLFVLHRKVLTSESSVTLVDSAEFKFRVIDAHIVNHAAGGAGDTCTVRNGSNAITDAMDAYKSDKVVTRAGTIDDAYATIDKEDSLVVVTASAAPVDVYITCVRE